MTASLSRLATSFAVGASAILVAIALLFASAPAKADDCRGAAVSAAQAIEIAKANGLSRVKELECDDGKWEVEGWNVAGREMEVDVDSRTGRVLDIDYD